MFLEPYLLAPDPPRDALDFGTHIQKADLYLPIDTTSSMGQPIDSLKENMTTPMTGLIDRAKQAIPEIWIGVGDFREYNATSPIAYERNWKRQHCGNRGAPARLVLPGPCGRVAE